MIFIYQIIPVVQPFLGNRRPVAQRLEQGEDRLRVGFISCVAFIIVSMRVPKFDLRECPCLALRQLDMILLHLSAVPI